jgi:hypothetical protein
LNKIKVKVNSSTDEDQQTMEENTTGGSKNNVLRSITPNLLNEVGHTKDQ